MKLATSTWVKIALIGLLCLGVCGWLGGCGRGVWFASSPLWPGGVLGCAGINAVDGVLSGLAQPGNYETTTEGTHLDGAHLGGIRLEAGSLGSGFVVARLGQAGQRAIYGVDASTTQHTAGPQRRAREQIGRAHV